MSITITLTDEVNAHIEGLTAGEVEYLQERTKLPVKGAFMDAAFKTGNWDGKRSLVGAHLNFQEILPTILDILIDELNVPEASIDLVDQRDFSTLQLPTAPIGDDFLLDELGFTLRDIQIASLNSLFANQKGLLNMAPNSGKSAICLAISKYYDGHIPTIVTVPSRILVKQMQADYEKSGLNFKAFTSIPPKKRKAIIEETPHLILTHKLLGNVLDDLDGVPYAIMYDEAHIFGEVLANGLRRQLRNCPVRVGLSGSFPKRDRYKMAMIRAHMGAGDLYEVTSKELESKGYSSKALIDIHVTQHEEMEQLSADPQAWSWETEKDYLDNHPIRIGAIADHIKRTHAMDPVNTMVLSSPAMAEALGRILEVGFIIDETPDKQRESLLAELDHDHATILPCTFGTIGTGTSKSNVQRVYLIDVGKVDHWIIQGIGRGVRLDGKANTCHIVDISANTKYSKRHRGTRKTLLKSEKYEVNTKNPAIPVIWSKDVPF